MTTNKQLQDMMEEQARAAYMTLNDGRGVGISNSVVDELRDGAQVIENVGEFLKDHAAQCLFHACASDLNFALIELRKLAKMIDDVRDTVIGYRTSLCTLESLINKKD